MMLRKAPAAARAATNTAKTSTRNCRMVPTAGMKPNRNPAITTGATQMNMIQSARNPYRAQRPKSPSFRDRGVCMPQAASFAQSNRYPNMMICPMMGTQFMRPSTSVAFHQSSSAARSPHARSMYVLIVFIDTPAARRDGYSLEPPPPSRVWIRCWISSISSPSLASTSARALAARTAARS